MSNLEIGTWGNFSYTTASGDPVVRWIYIHQLDNGRTIHITALSTRSGGFRLRFQEARKMPWGFDPVGRPTNYGSPFRSIEHAKKMGVKLAPLYQSAKN